MYLGPFYCIYVLSIVSVSFPLYLCPFHCTCVLFIVCGSFSLNLCPFLWTCVLSIVSVSFPLNLGPFWISYLHAFTHVAMFGIPFATTLNNNTIQALIYKETKYREYSTTKLRKPRTKYLIQSVVPAALSSSSLHFPALYAGKTPTYH